MLRIISLLAATAALVGCSGQRMINVLTPPWGYQRHADIAYGDLARQKLDVYVPDGVETGAPVVVFFYGGRWSGGDKAGFKFVAQALTTHGYVVVLPDYRLYPQVTFPAFVRDGAQAVAWAHAHAAQHGGDPEKLFVMGHSAGAHIAAMLATNAGYLEAVGGSVDWLAGMIGMAGPYEFLPITADDLKAIFGPESQWPATQPVNFVSGNEPPMLLMHGGADETVHAEDSEILAERVRAAGGSARLVIYDGIGHIRLIAQLAAPLRWLGPQSRAIAAFIDAVAANESTEKASPESR